MGGEKTPTSSYVDVTSCVSVRVILSWHAKLLGLVQPFIHTRIILSYKYNDANVFQY